MFCDVSVKQISTEPGLMMNTCYLQALKITVLQSQNKTYFIYLTPPKKTPQQQPKKPKNPHLQKPPKQQTHKHTHTHDIHWISSFCSLDYLHIFGNFVSQFMILQSFCAGCKPWFGQYWRDSLAAGSLLVAVLGHCVCVSGQRNQVIRKGILAGVI